MRGPLDYEMLWNQLERNERTALLRQILTEGISGQNVKPWHELPASLKIELLKLDWEFSLGRRF